MSKKRKLLLYGVAGLIAKVALGFAAHHVLVGSHYVTHRQRLRRRRQRRRSTRRSRAKCSSPGLGHPIGPRRRRPRHHRSGRRATELRSAPRPTIAARCSACANTMRRKLPPLAQVRARQAELARAETDYARRRALAQTGAVSGEELTATRAAYECGARQSWRGERKPGSATRPDPRPEPSRTIRKPRPPARRWKRRGSRSSAPSSARRSTASSRSSTRKSASAIEIGQPLMIIAPLQDAYVDANFKEGQLGRVRDRPAGRTHVGPLRRRRGLSRPRRRLGRRHGLGLRGDPGAERHGQLDPRRPARAGAHRASIRASSPNIRCASASRWKRASTCASRRETDSRVELITRSNTSQGDMRNVFRHSRG